MLAVLQYHQALTRAGAMVYSNIGFVIDDGTTLPFGPIDSRTNEQHNRNHSLLNECSRSLEDIACSGVTHERQGLLLSLRGRKHEFVEVRNRRWDT
jgi:hypothetical protein